MRLSNFTLDRTDGKSPLYIVYWGSIDRETGMLWWKKKERVGIRHEYYGAWHFVDSGAYLPVSYINACERAWIAQHGGKS